MDPEKIKNPGSMTALDPGFPFISEITGTGSVRELIPSIIQAGLLTPGSFAPRAFPSGVLSDSGILRNLSPVTAAGPSSIHTKFPFQPVGPLCFPVREKLKERPARYLNS
jgi:hypothetical protein